MGIGSQAAIATRPPHNLEGSIRDAYLTGGWAGSLLYLCIVFVSCVVVRGSVPHLAERSMYGSAAAHYSNPTGWLRPRCALRGQGRAATSVRFPAGFRSGVDRAAGLPGPDERFTHFPFAHGGCTTVRPLGQVHPARRLARPRGLLSGTFISLLSGCGIPRVR